MLKKKKKKPRKLENMTAPHRSILDRGQWYILSESVPNNVFSLVFYGFFPIYKFLLAFHCNTTSDWLNNTV